MVSSSVTRKGQVTIPKEVRRELGIRPGSKIAFAVKNGKAEVWVLRGTSHRGASGFGMLRARRGHLPADIDVVTLLAPARRSAR